MYLSLFLIFTLGILGGYIFDKIKIPKLIFYLILGILLGPSVFNILDNDLLNLSSTLRQIALVIILTRAGLSLDINTLKKIGRSAILMSFIPAVFEMIGVLIFAPILLKISHIEALLLGSVLAAVSPAVIVPRMIKLKELGYGNKNKVCELVLAGSSIDDIFVIVLFYGFKEMNVNNNFDLNLIYQIPLSIILGILIGVVVGFILHIIFKYIKINTVSKLIFTLGISLLLLYLENILKDYIKISMLLAIITYSIILLRLDKDESIKLQKSYNNVWSLFEILLFTLVGASTLVEYAFSIDGLIIVGLILIALIFRSIGVIISILGSKYNIKEKIFIIISYLPKATVQASIGGIALAEGIECGELVLTCAVISILLTAPIGAILIDNLHKRLLLIE